jgi:hypothetical protein
VTPDPSPLVEAAAAGAPAHLIESASACRGAVGPSLDSELESLSAVVMPRAGRSAAAPALQPYAALARADPGPWMGPGRGPGQRDSDHHAMP